MARTIRRRQAARWSGSEDECIRQLAGYRDRFEIAGVLNHEYGTTRTPHAVNRRAQRIGVDLALRDPYWSMGMFRQLFGCRWDAYKRLIAADALPMVMVSVGTTGTCSEWRIRESAIETFIRTMPWAYNPARLFPSTHRLAQIGRLMHRRDPWLTAEECADHFGIASGTIREWIRKDLIPYRYRMIGSTGQANAVGIIVVQSGDVAPLVPEAIAHREMFPAHALELRWKRHNAEKAA